MAAKKREIGWGGGGVEDDDDEREKIDEERMEEAKWNGFQTI